MVCGSMSMLSARICGESDLCLFMFRFAYGEILVLFIRSTMLASSSTTTAFWRIASYFALGDLERLRCLTSCIEPSA